MGQVLHGIATTTEAVRRAIQNSQESLKRLANRYDINPKTVAKWKKRVSVRDYSQMSYLKSCVMVLAVLTVAGCNGHRLGNDSPEPGWVSVSAGAGHTCAVTTSGSVHCWGKSGYGQLGNGTDWGDSSKPVDVLVLYSGVKSISAGREHTCAVTQSGAVKCWGANKRHELGYGGYYYLSRSAPDDVQDFSAHAIGVAAGTGFSCALTTNRQVKCWGDNGSGQLGNGTTDYADEHIPRDVFGLNAVSSITAGFRHACAVTTDGKAMCWGNNSYGQLGDGTTENRNVPVQVQGISGKALSIAAGKTFTCALTDAGSVMCWGYNDAGQLGSKEKQRSNTPVEVAGLESGVMEIVAGDFHACALTTSGILKCWGYNGNGQLGDGTRHASNTPVDVIGMPAGIASVSAGAFHTCAITHSGKLLCWGSNSDGELGDGSRQYGTSSEVHFSSVEPPSAPPRRKAEKTNKTASVASIHPMGDRTCVLTTAGGVKCWGRNYYGQLGDGLDDSQRKWTPDVVPIDVVGLDSGVVSISGRGTRTCALLTSGEVKCWGEPLGGALWNSTEGIDARTKLWTATGIDDTKVAGLYAGDRSVCVVTSTGGVKCWGDNSYGTLGDGTKTDCDSPVDVVGLNSGVKSLAQGNTHFCALTDAGGVMCWGGEKNHPLGTRETHLIPEYVEGLTSGVTSITAGCGFTCALTSSGGVKCWGSDGDKLGDGRNGSIPRHEPRDVLGLTSGVASVSAGCWHTCALTTSGEVLCWGGNGSGTLGDGTTVRKNAPVKVRGLDEEVTYLGVGHHTCVLTRTGRPFCWGANRDGQLGDGTKTDQVTAVPVTILDTPPRPADGERDPVE